MSHRFCQYSADELDACGRAFVEAFTCPRCAKTSDTTKAIKAFFARTAQEGCSALGCDGRGELMLDQCHVSYRPRMTGESGLDYWDSILTTPIVMRLAVESEWGKYASLKQSLVDLLDDAQKLALVRADAKVMLFATRRATDRDEFVRRIQTVRAAASDPVPWLWIDLPWEVSASNPPVYGVLAS